MNDIISVDEKNRIVRVEPMVTISQLNNYLIRLGWMLPVVPEIDYLTLGGLVMGGGIETTSHKYGLFQFICTSYELVMGDGSVKTCCKDENMELYSAIPFSYGTLGFLTAMDIMIIPYQPYIKLAYIPVHSLDKAVETLENITNDPTVDSVEGLMLTKDSAVIMSGKFVDKYEVKKV